jgi:hypothetical protein
MKKVLLLLLMIIQLMTAACSAEKAEISASANSQEHTEVTDNAESTPPTDIPENTAVTVTAVTDNAQELEWRSQWKSMYDEVMANWQPAQLFSTKEYTYGIDELSISQNDDGSYTVSFIFGAVFNLYPGDYRMDDSRLRVYELYYPELYLEKDAEQELTLEHNYPAGTEEGKPFIGAYCRRFEYHCDEKPQALYFKTPEFRMIDVHSEFLVDDPSLYTVEYGETVTGYDRETHKPIEITPVNFVFKESLNGKWKKATLRFNNGEIVYGLWSGLRDGGYDYFRFDFPEASILDSGYTFVLSEEYVDLPRQVFEIYID